LLVRQIVVRANSKIKMPLIPLMWSTII